MERAGLGVRELTRAEIGTLLDYWRVAASQLAEIPGAERFTAGVINYLEAAAREDPPDEVEIPLGGLSIRDRLVVSEALFKQGEAAGEPYEAFFYGLAHGVRSTVSEQELQILRRMSKSHLN